LVKEGVLVERKKIDYSQLIDADRLPRHIAIIMDGNGRWAKRKLLPRTMGHRAGMKSLKETVKACSEIGVPVLTVYAFSTENWKRPLQEVDYLMNLLVEFMHKELAELNEDNVHINVLGDYNSLPRKCQAEIDEALVTTRDNNGLVFNIALNYGSRNEILRAVNNLAQKVVSGDLSPGDITEDVFSSHLYTGGLADPDLLIRTAGEMRISNFLLWQIAYTEFYVADCMWPDFTREDLYKAILDYQQRDRRFGGISKDRQDEKNA